ncbi:MAG: hypothetical protein Q8878_08545, partial [Bacillota bacterium]|nr:hypothetical protein [Bacillota bacterium]
MFNLHLNKRLAGAVAGTKEPTREKKGQAVLKEALFLGLRFVLAFLLSKTVIFSEYAPFGVAFCAALGGAPGSAAAFFGSFLGYMFSVGNVDGLKYAASCVLCFSAGAIFKDTKAMSYRFFMPAVAALSLASVGFVFIGNSGKIINDVLLFVSEIILAAGSAWFYSDIFGKGRDDAAADLVFDREKTAAILVLTITVLGSLCGIYIFQIISPARVISVLLVMSAAYLGGAGSGTALGVATGIVMDAAAGNGIFFAAAYGLCALTAGAAKGKSRLLFTMIYVAANAAVSLWSAGNPQYLPGLYEAFIASVLFYLIPVQYLQKAKACLFPGSDVKSSDYSDKIKKYAGRRLNLAAGAFQELYASMSFGIDGLKRRNDEDIAAVFDCAADKVCSKCGAKHICWERDYVSTVGALNDMSVNMAKRGQAVKSDFPGYFASRCLYFDQFTEALNSAMRALLQRRQYKK